MEFKSRQVHAYIWDDELSQGKMVFLSGPRQIGKTSYARALLAAGQAGRYFNWDNAAVRRLYAKDPFFFLAGRTGEDPYLVVFDEIHKRPKWKDTLKGIYDSIERTCRIFVTGSARLEMFRKSGDSLVGRYVHFHMMPVSIGELAGTELGGAWLCASEHWRSPWSSLRERIDAGPAGSEAAGLYDHLYHFSGFPEPLSRASERFLFKWKSDYLSLLLTVDLREISEVRQIDTVEKIALLLPERVGSPLSINSLARDVESSFPTVRNHILQLRKLWLVFGIRPFSKNLARAVRKEEKMYFTNWTYASDEAKAFENFMATELMRACVVWTDLAFGKADLWYARNFDGNEVDFLITLNGKPALCVEAKLSDSVIATPTRTLAQSLNTPLIQVVHRHGILRRVSDREYVMSAARFLSLLP